MTIAQKIDRFVASQGMQAGLEGLVAILSELAGALSSLAPAFSASSTYAVGDYCVYEGELYKCKTQISTAAAWDATKWDKTNVGAELKLKANAQ